MALTCWDMCCRATKFAISSRSLPWYDDDQWRYSPDRALASLMRFMTVCSTMWGYQLHDRPVLDTLIQPSETSSSNYQRLSWRSRETRVRNGRWILPTSTYRARRVRLHAVNLWHGTDGFTSPPKESVLRILSPLKLIVLGRVWTRDLGSSGKHATTTSPRATLPWYILHNMLYCIYRITNHSSAILMLMTVV
jgi:hypothetical protein